LATFGELVQTVAIKDIVINLAEFGGQPDAIRQVLGDNPHKEQKLGDFS
jgi:hypothetical protein